jgi:TPR repeat protein
MDRPTKKERAEMLWLRAEQREEEGKVRVAFRLMLAAAKLGSIAAQLNVGNYYDDGLGVRRNRAAALYWYKRAYRRGDSSAAHNIGVLWRNEGNHGRSLYWFSRAVKMGDEESNLDIGKHFLRNENNPKRAIPYFKRVKPTGWVSEVAAEEAKRLLRQAQRQVKRRSRQLT